MFLRNVLLAIGAVFVLAGVGLMIAWYNSQPKAPVGVAEPRVEAKQVVLVAKRAIPSGTKLSEEDIAEKEIGPGEARPGNISRESKKEFLGARTLQKLNAGEPLVASGFKPADQRCLPEELAPGSRALTISVDPTQSVSGLVSPNDHVDVILTQAFDDKVTTDPGRKTAGETVLRNVKVIAVGQSMNPRCNAPPAVAISGAASTEDASLPKRVTLELFGRDPETLLVAAKLGTFQLAVLPSETGDATRREDEGKTKPVWASEVSPALDENAQHLKQVSIRVYSGTPKSVAYLCSRSACAPSDVTTAISEYQEGNP
jgi:pilus assembly protein CpaB